MDSSRQPPNGPSSLPPLPQRWELHPSRGCCPLATTTTSIASRVGLRANPMAAEVVQWPTHPLARARTGLPRGGRLPKGDAQRKFSGRLGVVETGRSGQDPALRHACPVLPCGSLSCACGCPDALMPCRGTAGARRWEGRCWRLLGAADRPPLSCQMGITGKGQGFETFGACEWRDANPRPPRAQLGIVLTLPRLPAAAVGWE